MLGLDRPHLILILGLALSCLALVLVVILLYIRYSAARKRAASSEDVLQRIYFDIKDSLTKTISSGSPFRHTAADYNNCLTRHFGIRRLVIYISSRGRYTPLIWHNTDLPGINKLYFTPAAELVKKLTHLGHPLWFDRDEPHDNLARLLYEKLDMKVALPIMFGKQLYGFVVLSESDSYRLEDMAGYLVSLTDQLAYSFEISKKHHSSRSSRFQEKKPSSEQTEAEKVEKRVILDLLDDNIRLLKIYNENQLFSKFMRVIEAHVNPSFAFVFLPEKKKSRLSVAHSIRTVPAEIEKCYIKSADAMVKILSRDFGVHRVEHILEALGPGPVLQTFSRGGCKLLASFPLPQRRIGFLGLGEKKVSGGDYSPEEINIVETFCQTLRLTLDNIHQFRKIEELSYTDSMTGLYNYRYFYKRLTEEILRAKRFERFLALVIFDIDEFKIINDTHGHQTGDHILKQLGMLIHNSVRSIDIVSRYGGEEFCVIMPETDKEACEQFMERLRVKILEFEFRDRSNRKCLNISVSLGGAIYPTDATRIDRLIYCADMALLESKQSGRNKVCLYNPQIEKSSR
ncbi:MAG TPA: diguanylate cyclase [candidate division Zixibacteria bacterium]|nr:diguanylate cyclase [candidate division Zixibacteria bacterium]